MWENKLIELLSRFTSGDLHIPEFQKAVDNRLFDLRINPSMSPEKELLSKIQLYLHEIDEGLRDEFEIYMLTQSILEQYLTLSLPREPKTKRYSFIPPAPRTESWDTIVPEPSHEKMPAIV
jgi:hypothetical protein